MRQLLPFKLGAESYALELSAIQEVVENRAVFPMPGVPEEVLGAIAFHGQIVPVIDLPRLLGFPGGERSERLIVLTGVVGPVALVVDLLQPLISVDVSQQGLAQSDSQADCIVAVINWQDEMLSLLDLEVLQQRLQDLCSFTGG